MKNLKRILSVLLVLALALLLGPLALRFGDGGLFLLLALFLLGPGPLFLGDGGLQGRLLPETLLAGVVHGQEDAQARRRHKELLEKGQVIDFETVKQEIADRDYADTHRAVAPLKQAEDAVVVDTSDLDLAGSLDAMYTLVKERLDL